LALLLAADGFALFGCQAFLLDWKSCLEYADYLTIFNKPELEAIFTNRHVSAADIHAQKEAFRISEIRNVIESFDPQLAKIFNELYQRSIDFGGHPNPCGTFSAVKIENSGPPILSMTAFMTDPPILQHARRALHCEASAVACRARVLQIFASEPVHFSFNSKQLELCFKRDRVYAVGSFTKQCCVTYCGRVGDKPSLN
jgi:hypothetical protein